MSDDLSKEQLDILAKKREEHGEVWYLKTSQGLLVFRAPNPGEWGRFKKMAGDDKRKSDADVTLSQDVVVHPSLEDFRAMCGKRPGLATRVAGEAVSVAMDQETSDAKKFESV